MGDHPSISTTLLDRVRLMRPDAWARLVQLFGPLVYRWCRRAGLDRDDSADVAQEVFASVARGVGSFRRDQGSGSFSAWLATITRNRIRDHQRRIVGRAAAAGGTEAQLRMQNVAELDERIADTARAESEISRRALELVRAEFEPRTWEAFWRTAVDGQPPADVAESLGVSVFVVYQAKSRVLRRLRRELEDLT